jgi:membrane protease YdiL (CAAX protease family)
MKDSIKQEINNLVQGEKDKTPYLALMFAIVIIFIYCYFGSYSFFEQTFPNISDLDYYKIIYHNSMSFILFFCLGTLFVKFVMKKNLKDYGLCLGEKKIGKYIMLLAIVVVPIITLTVLLSPEMIQTYPLVDLNVYNKWWQWALYFFSYVLYYIGWEFIFRAVLLFGVKDRFGFLGAIFVTALISALIHTSIAGFGKPMVETLSAIFAGFIFAGITLRTKSIYYSLFIHILVGVCTDLYIFFLV